SSTPVAVAVPGTVTRIAAGWAFNLALTSTGAVYAWGFNGDGELGTTSTGTCALYYACSTTPVAVSLGGATVKAIATGWDHPHARHRWPHREGHRLRRRPQPRHQVRQRRHRLGPQQRRPARRRHHRPFHHDRNAGGDEQRPDGHRRRRLPHPRHPVRRGTA